VASYIDAGTDPLGYTVSAKGARENWSYGTNTLSVCTRADGIIYSASKDYGGAQTSQRC